MLVLIFLFSSACQAQAVNIQSDNTYNSQIIIRNNRGSAINNLRKFKDGLLYTSQKELFFNLEKVNSSIISSDLNQEDFQIHNLIVDGNDFYLLSSAGLHKNFQKIFNKEACFHLEKHKNKIWISCQSGIYSSKIKDDNKYNWELDSSSPQFVTYFSLNDKATMPKYAASSKFGFFKYEKGRWQRRNTGLRASPDGDYHLRRFITAETYGIETIYLPCPYGIAISNNQAKDFFIDSEGLEKENGLIQVQDIKKDSNENLFLVTNTGAYRAGLELIPRWSKIPISDLRKSENNFTRFSAIDISNSELYLSTSQGEIISLKDKAFSLSNKALYGESFFDSKDLIEKFLLLEPKIAEVHKKALEFAGIATGKTYRSYIKRARLRNLAPKFETYLERDDDKLLAIQTTGQDDLDDGIFSTSFDRVDQNRNNNSLNTGMRLSWDFTKVFYDEELIDINNNARLTANIRENLLTEVTQLYFQRKETLVDTINWYTKNQEIKTDKEVLRRKLALEESLAQLDARTGSWYSQALGHRANKAFSNFNTKDPRTLKTMELYSNVKIN